MGHTELGQVAEMLEALLSQLSGQYATALYSAKSRKLERRPEDMMPVSLACEVVVPNGLVKGDTESMAPIPFLHDSVGTIGRIWSETGEVLTSFYRISVNGASKV